MNLSEERNERIARVRTYMSAHNIDVAVIQVKEDIFWLTGYSTPGAPPCQSLILKPDSAVIYSRALEVTNADGPTASYDEDDKSPCDWLSRHVLRGRIAYVGVQPNNRMSSPVEFSSLHESAVDAGVDFVPMTDVIRRMRTQKSDRELAMMRRAADICSVSMVTAIEATTRPGATEKSIAGAAYQSAALEGGDYPAYPPFVAAGTNGCKGHYACSDKHHPLRAEESVIIELAGCFQRYHVAMMRTVFLWTEVPAEILRAEALVKTALARMRETACSGHTYEDIRVVGRDTLEPLTEEGWTLSKRTCYNIGIAFPIDWGEVDNSPVEPLCSGATLHILPWVNHPKWGAIAISDTVVVGDDGGTSLFSNPPPETSVCRIPTPVLDKALKVRTLFGGMRPTPIHHVEVGGHTVIIKDESTRLGRNSFKALGAGFAIASELMKSRGIYDKPFEWYKRRDGEERIRFITASDGNHGAGVSWAASTLGHTSIVLFPVGTDMSRLLLVGGPHAGSALVTEVPYDETVKMAAEIAAEKGWPLIQDTSWEGYTEIPDNIMGAYALIMLEVAEELTIPPTHIILQVGVGSFAGGITRCLRESPFFKDTKLVTVEAEDSACLYASLKAGVATSVESGSGTISAGLDCCTVSKLAWNVLRDEVDFAVTVSDEVVARGVRANKVVGGESGAAVGVGLISSMSDEQKTQLGIDTNSRILVFNTEGITAPATTARIMSEDDTDVSIKIYEV